MAYLITHFFPGGTESQYEASKAAAHKDGLPAGQTLHAAGPTEGGWLVVALWDSKESCDTFIGQVLVPALRDTEGAFEGAPQERSCEVHNLERA